MASAGKLAIFFCYKKAGMIKRSSDISNLEIGISFSSFPCFANIATGNS